ncbi:MAG: prepilin-type N-terminal cleavage/methylation domain-containing protein, partial [Lentisphaerae bacterium]
MMDRSIEKNMFSFSQFTLLELILVLVIMGTFAGIAGARLGRFVGARKVHSDAMILARRINDERLKCAMNGRLCEIVVDEERGEIVFRRQKLDDTKKFSE